MSSVGLRLRSGLIFAVAMLFLSLSISPAQENSGIYGVVRAQSPNGLLGSPVAGVLVSAHNSEGEVIARSVTNVSGAYRLVVPFGSYRLTAAHPAYRVFDTGGTILFVQSGHFTLFNISLEPREQGIGEIRGYVRDPSGEPVANALVLVLDENDEEETRVATGDDGGYSIELPPGVYKLAAEHPENGRSDQQEISLREGDNLEISIAMKAAAEPTGGFQGLVRARAAGGAAGRPITGAVVTAGSEDGAITRSVTTNNIGFYKLTLPPGRYKIAVAHQDFEPFDSGDELMSAEERINTWNALLQPVAPLTDAPTCREQFRVSVGQSYGERHSVFLRVRHPGVISVVYRWSGDADTLALIVQGPDSVPRRIDGTSPLRLSVQVQAELLALGSQWQVDVRNFSGGGAEGTLTVNYPCEK